MDLGDEKSNSHGDITKSGNMLWVSDGNALIDIAPSRTETLQVSPSESLSGILKIPLHAPSFGRRTRLIKSQKLQLTRKYDGSVPSYVG